MTLHDITSHIISQQAGLVEALGRLNALSGGAMTLFAIDDAGRMVGTLTDGDVRRALIAGHTLESTVATVMQRQFKAIAPAKHQVAVEMCKRLRLSGIRLVPVLDADGRPVSLIDLKYTANILPMSAMIMAGGRGERLRPLTDTTPKPLLEIGGRAIIDYSVDMLDRYAINDIYISVRYLAEKIEEHFASRSDVHCVREDRPLGTIGVMSLIDFDHDDVLLMNSDQITDVALDDMYAAHKSSGASITVAAIPYSVSVPYAILSTVGDRVTELCEKPTFSYYANAGVYIIGSEARALLRPGEHCDATDLIDRAIAAGQHVTYFPISGTWIDIGTPSDYRHACELMHFAGGDNK